MPIYYRSDTRSPAEIFEKGFSLRPEYDEEDEWWHVALRLIDYKDKKGRGNLAVDAYKNAAVCLTTKFESAAIFPIDAPEDYGANPVERSYLYAISLPEAVKVEYEENERPVYFMSQLPKGEDLKKYKNTYLFTTDNRLFYVDRNCTVQELKLSINGSFIRKILKTEKIEPDNKIPIHQKLSPKNMTEFWRIITSLNEGHTRVNVQFIKETMDTIKNPLDERALYFMPNLPNMEDLKKYKNRYIFTNDENQKLLNIMYVDAEGMPHKLEYSGSEADHHLLTEFYNNNTNQDLSLDNILNKELLSRLWNIIASNTGHAHKGYALVNRSIVPTDIKETVIDLHSLQATQALNIQQSLMESKQSLFQKDEEKRISKIGALAGWPLYAYEAVAYKVPPENIICAIRIQRGNKTKVTVLEPAEKHDAKPYTSHARTFKTQGEIQINGKFNPHQKLSFGKGNNTQEIELDYNQEKADVLLQFEKAKHDDTLETPDVYFGLGGKTL